MPLVPTISLIVFAVATVLMLHLYFVAFGDEFEMNTDSSVGKFIARWCIGLSTAGLFASLVWLVFEIRCF